MEKSIVIKVFFRFFSDMLEQEMIETLSAIIVNESRGLYQLEGIPLYVPFVASGDIVFAEYDDTEGKLTYRETIEPSGNSTIWVVILDDDTSINDIRSIFEDFDCRSAAASDRYFAMEVKAEINYMKIRNKLNELRSEGIIDFAEPYLSGKHQY